MDSEIIGAYIGAGASLLVGIGGIIAAGIANSRAKMANKHAEDANKIAADALTQAAESNKIAKDANALSEEANSISRSNAAKQFDPSHVDWAVKWDTETAILHVTNSGRDTAHGVSVLVQGDEIDDLIEREEPVPRNEHIEIPFPQIAENRKNHQIEAARHYRAMVNAGYFTVREEFECPLVIDVRWTSDLGNPGFEQFQLDAS